MVDGVTGIVPPVVDGVTGIVPPVLNDVTGIVPPVANEVTGIVPPLVNEAAGTVQEVTDTTDLVGTIDGVTTGAELTAESALTTARTGVETMTGTVGELAGPASTSLHQVAEAVPIEGADPVLAGGSRTVDNLASTVDQAGDDVADTAAVLDEATDTVSGVVRNETGIITGLLPEKESANSDDGDSDERNSSSTSAKRSDNDSAAEHDEGDDKNENTSDEKSENSIGGSALAAVDTATEPIHDVGSKALQALGS